MMHERIYISDKGRQKSAFAAGSHRFLALVAAGAILRFCFFTRISLSR